MNRGETRHENYELLNLLGYGLAKFDNDFIKKFGFSTKNAFFNWFVELGLVKTASVVKNRMDLFDPYFNNDRRGWWQKSDVYIHRKILIDSLFGNENVDDYANIVKMLLKDQYNVENISGAIKPIIKTKFKSLQETGLEAEMFFLNNFGSIDIFKNGSIEDARLYGDGYDFQIDVDGRVYLAEIKGIRQSHGKFRMTEKEFRKAEEYADNYIITIVMNLEKAPVFKLFNNPTETLDFREKYKKAKAIKEYHLVGEVTL